MEVLLHFLLLLLGLQGAPRDWRGRGSSADMCDKAFPAQLRGPARHWQPWDRCCGLRTERAAAAGVPRAAFVHSHAYLRLHTSSLLLHTTVRSNNTRSVWIVRPRTLSGRPCPMAPSCAWSAAASTGGWASTSLLSGRPLCVRGRAGFCMCMQQYDTLRSSSGSSMSCL